MGGDFNGHVGGDMGGGFGTEQINDGGIILLDWAIGNGLRLMNTCFQKMKRWLTTLSLGETETMIYYILVNNNYRSTAKEVRVIGCE